jgi:hypothetical protein
MINVRESLRKKLSGTSAPIASFALAALLCAGISGHAQDVQGQNNNNMNMQGPNTMPAPNPDVTPAQLASVNQFLESHPELDEQLRKDPTLLNNQEYVEDHPALQEYLQQHPEIREEVRENPNAFMRQEQRFDRREDHPGEWSQLETTNEFLESHPEIAEQLRKDPSLVNNPRFVQEHPALQQYLQQNPEVREQFQANPSTFMQREQRFDRREDRVGLPATDRFFDSHPEIAEQLQKNPSLVNNQKFVQDHPALQQYLQQHPEVRDEFQENPNAYMRQEERFDRREEMPGEQGMRGPVARTDRFLDSHPEIAEQLQKDPSLVNNQHFVQGHPALQEYLQQHPEVRQQFQANPTAFMQQQQRFEQREDGPGTSFGQFLGSHSGIAHQISQNPSLLNNKEYLEDHPDLQRYLKAHPEAKQEFSENPSAFMSALGSGASMPGTANTAGTTSAPSTKNSATSPKPKP